MTENGSGPHVDYVRRIFVTRNGTELRLKRISPLIIERMDSDQSGKPEIPVVEVEIGGKHKRNEPNPNDPDYIEALAAWRKAKRFRVMHYSFTHGVENDPPKEFVADLREYFPDSPFREFKYLWVASLIDEESEDITMFIQAVTGQTAVTEKGLEQATDSFPGDGGREGHQDVPAGETASVDPVQPGV